MTRKVTIVSAAEVIDEEQNLGREGHIIEFRVCIFIHPPPKDDSRISVSCIEPDDIAPTLLSKTPRDDLCKSDLQLVVAERARRVEKRSVFGVLIAPIDDEAATRPGNRFFAR